MRSAVEVCKQLWDGKGQGRGGLERTRKPRLSWKTCFIKPSAGVMVISVVNGTPGKKELKRGTEELPSSDGPVSMSVGAADLDF